LHLHKGAVVVGQGEAAARLFIGVEGGLRERDDGVVAIIAASEEDADQGFIVRGRAAALGQGIDGTETAHQCRGTEAGEETTT